MVHALRRHIAEMQAEQRRLLALEPLAERLLVDPYFRAVLSLIEADRSEGRVDLVDDRIDEYTGGPLIRADPAERCEIIPFLTLLGYDVLHYHDDSSCPMSVGWEDWSPSAEDMAMYEKNGWTWYPPGPGR